MYFSEAVTTLLWFFFFSFISIFSQTQSFLRAQSTLIIEIFGIIVSDSLTCKNITKFYEKLLAEIQKGSETLFLYFSSCHMDIYIY